jgi:hypothetical protein
MEYLAVLNTVIIVVIIAKEILDDGNINIKKK